MTYSDIKSIDVFTIGKKKFYKATINYNNNSKVDINSATELKRVLNGWASALGKTVDELIQDTSLVKQFQYSDKKKPVVITVTCLAAATVVAVVAGKFITNKKKSAENEKGTAVVTIAPTQVPVVTNAPTQEPTPRIDEVLVEEDRCSTIVRKILNNEYVSEDEIIYLMDEVSSKSYMNMPGIERLLRGGQMKGDKNCEIDFYKWFPEDSVDYNVIKVICFMHGDMTHNAFVNDQALTRKEYNNFMNKINGFVFDGKLIASSGYYDINPVTRAMIDIIMMNTLTADKSYTCYMNGQKCGYDVVVEELIEMYDTAMKSTIKTK